MGKFLLRRMAYSLTLVLLATCLGYLLAASSLNPRSNFEGRNPPPPKASVDAQLDALNLNDETPLLERFGVWITDLAHGDLGQMVNGGDVREEMGRRIGVTVRLVVVGAVLGGFFGVLVGVLGAVRQYKPSDYISTALSFVLLATPVFLLAVLLKVAALKVNTAAGETIFYNTGEYTPDLEGSVWTMAGDRLQHFILPTLAIALPQIAFFSRYQRGTMLDVLGSEFLRTAQAKGLRRRQALVRHGLRTALIPMVTFFAFQFGILITGAIFTETIFSWHGMGEWLVNSIRSNDVNAVAAITLFTAVLILLAGFVADVAYAALDPRVRVQ
jgi:peptide/nickel transport system permease protein